ncbi:MAG: glycosyltransferase family 1 protein [Roseiarcus sp.]
MLNNRPKVTLDIGPLLEDQWTGIPVFTRRLARALLLHGEIDLDFAVNCEKFPRAVVMQALSLGTGTFLREGWQREGASEYELADVDGAFLFPTVKTQFGIASRQASTVHDMSTLFMPENHEEANIAFHLDNFARELATDDVVFCISEATRAALLTAFPSVASKARMLYQYADWPDEFELYDRHLAAPRVGRYAVVVGTIEPRKNLGLIIRALALPELARSELKFVVIGKKGWLVDTFLAGLSEAERARLVFSGFVSEFVKYRLIRHAEFLIFPSLYEGFGIPALEAMSLGKPVLAALTSSLPEVVGDAGIFFDPYSPTDFAGAVAEISDPRCLAELAPKAIAQNATFNWRRMAEPIVEWVRG